ncbi:putative Ig domain-containing protein, partial [Micromonospora parva]
SLGGSPTTPGTYPFTLRMTDKNKLFDEQAATIVVATAAATFTSGDPPAGTQGRSYSFRFTADGDSDIAFALAGGALPGGLTLDKSGRLSGVPGSAGTFTFTVQATGRSTSATRNVSLVVAPASPGTPTATPTDPAATPTPTASTDPAATPSESDLATFQPAPAPARSKGGWLPLTGAGSPLVLLLMGVLAFSVGGILLVLAYNRRRFTTPE